MLSNVVGVREYGLQRESVNLGRDTHTRCFASGGPGEYSIECLSFGLDGSSRDRSGVRYRFRDNLCNCQMAPRTLPQGKVLSTASSGITLPTPIGNNRSTIIGIGSSFELQVT